MSIITYNEENNIGRCISSVLPIADEVLIVDSFSTDKTEEIATSMGAKFVKNPFAGHIEQKNFALNLSTHEYVLSLDADEALSPELLEQIKLLKNKKLNFIAVLCVFLFSFEVSVNAKDQAYRLHNRIAGELLIQMQQNRR